jgi:gluconokinase/xylulokinase
MIPTLVPSDADGAPIGLAITWEDDRADDDGEAFREAAGAEALYRATGQWVDGRYLLPMLRWIDREEPARSPGLVLAAKDHLFHRLTGETGTDPSTAAGFGCYDLGSATWDPTLSGGLRLPQIRPTTHVAPLAAEAAAALGLPSGLPVAVGAADSVCGALGVGATSTGGRVALWGTSTVVLGVSRDLVLDPAHRYLVTPLALGQGWGLEMDLVSTGSAVAWLAAVLGEDESSLLELAASTPLGANGVTCLPFLGFGEQGARWDPTLRGLFSGLTLSHGRADIARALLEGIALEVRGCVRVLDEAGLPPAPLVAAGGATGSDAFATMLAGATGAPVVRVLDERWASARGAAIVAGAAVGIQIDPPSPSVGDAIEPDPAEAASWDELAALHDRLLATARLPR